MAFFNLFGVSGHLVNIISAISLVAMIITIRIANVGEKSIVRTSVIFHNFIFMLSSPPSLPCSCNDVPVRHDFTIFYSFIRLIKIYFIKIDKISALYPAAIL